jgi:hypothetical protein
MKVVGSLKAVFEDATNDVRKFPAWMKSAELRVTEPDRSTSEASKQCAAEGKEAAPGRQ